MPVTSIFEFQADLCKRMSSPIRIEIIHILRGRPLRVSEIARLTGHTQEIISRHLGVLRNGGIVTDQRHAQDVVYQITNPKIIAICDLMRDVLMEEASRRSKLMKGFQDENPG